MPDYSCAFTGHRPMRFSFGYDEEHEDCIRLKEVMAEQVEKLILAGVATFYSGMALGVDQWGFEIVLELKKKYPHIRLIAVRPCDTQANKWSAEQRERYYNLLAQCDDEVLLSYNYTPTCMLERNDYLVEHADFILTVYDGGKKGGTAYTVRRALAQDKHLIIIHPDTLEIVTTEDLTALERRSKLRVLTKEEVTKET